MADEKKPAGESTPAPASAPAPAQAQQQVVLDDTNTVSCYANFCRVMGTPEELIVDFALNNQPMGVPDKPIPVTQRIILNHYTAKRLLAALQMSIQRHETAFGVLETDVRKRVKQQPGASS